jgi:uncharacterized RDD family membrane protein YckC
VGAVTANLAMNAAGYAGHMATTPDQHPGALDLGEAETASFGRRFIALLIDWAIATAVAGLIVADLRTNPWPQLGVFVVAHAFFVGLFGRTIGMALAGIRCVSITDGGAVGIPRAVIRAVLLALVLPAVISDGDGRGLHDRAAKSVMARPRRA